MRAVTAPSPPLRRLRQRAAAAIAAWLALGAVPTVAACDGAIGWRGATLRLENDLFAGTDRNYTNGVALARVSHDIDDGGRPCLPRPARTFANFIAALDPGFWHGEPGTTRNLVVRAGQAMYTPADHQRRDLIVDDRPYAGLLYAGLTWNRRSQPAGSDWERLDSREANFGVIGPWSLARESQQLVHRLRGIERFRGWSHQLHSEPAVQVAMERRYRRLAEGAIQPGWASDVIVGHALRLGNIETAASATIEWRAGRNLPNDFGSYPIRPGAENRPPSVTAALRTSEPRSAQAPRPGTHAFASVEAKAVAWDFSLDGNLWRNSHHVTRRPLLMQAAVGISSQWLVAGHGMRLAVMRVWCTREFRGQHGNHAFGSIALSLEY